MALEHWQANDEFFGFFIDPEVIPTKIALRFTRPRGHVDRATAALRSVNAPNLEGPG